MIPKMEILQAIILGIVEGFTEFLPISSTGHLIVAEDLIGYKDSAQIFTIVTQTGAIAAVVWFYRFDLAKRVNDLALRDPDAKKFWLNLLIATLPVAVIGYLAQDLFDKYAVAVTIAIALIVGGIAMWLIETYHKTPKNITGIAKLEKITLSQAVQVGLYQVIALIPGSSRSATTIMGGLLAGMDRVTSTAFSFYLSIPVLLLAGGYQFFSQQDNLDSISGGGPALIAGTIAAFIVALLTIRWLLHYVAHRDFKPFAYYRIILGVIILIAVI
ncbi:undecaprenyl-diphosphate phosphatase [Candidatus Parcubacteria bacterium]|nr:undecaprenyl-diphosphate phosphatase [Candidatus Parcubacteria bacterium]